MARGLHRAEGMETMPQPGGTLPTGVMLLAVALVIALVALIVSPF